MRHFEKIKPQFNPVRAFEAENAPIPLTRTLKTDGFGSDQIPIAPIISDYMPEQTP